MIPSWRRGALGTAPALLWLLLFFTVPLGIMIVFSFWSQIDYRVEPVWNLGNYAAFLSQPSYRLSVVNSLVLTAETTVISLALAYPLAYAIAFKVAPRLQIPILAALVVPFVSSSVVRAYSWLTLLSETGALNAAAVKLGILSAPVDLAYTRTAALIGLVHYFVMLLTLTIFITLKRIDRSYLAAAADLGANGARTFLHVILPLSLPGVVSGAFLTIVLAFGDYVAPAILGGNTYPVLPQLLVQEVTFRADFPQGAAIGTVMMLILLAFAALQGLPEKLLGR